MASSLEGYKNKVVHVVTGDGRSFIGTLKVLRGGTLADVERLAEAITLCPDDVLVEYQNHVLLPLLSQLQRGSHSEKVNTCLLDTLRSVLDRLGGRQRDAEALRNVILTLLMFFCHPEGGFQPYASEDLLLRLSDIIHTIFTRIDPTLLVQVYTGQEFQVVVVPLIKTLVDLIGHRCKELKLCSIETLRASYLSSQIEVAKTVCNFLPGIASCLLREVMDFSEKSHRVFSAALHAFADSVRLVMTDEYDLGMDFYERSTPNLIACISTLQRVCCPPHFKECEPSCKYFATKILGNCSGHLEGAIPACLEILLTLEGPRALNLEELTGLTKLAESVSVKAKLLECFEKLFVRMPRISAVGLDAEKVAFIRQLHGLLRIHSGTIAKAIQNELSRRRFFTSLFQLVALDCSTLRISPSNQPCNEPIRNLHRQTKALDANAISDLRAFCQAFGASLDVATCRDILLECIRVKRWRAEAALICSFVIEGVRPEESGGTEFIDYIIEAFPVDDSTTSVLQRVFLLAQVRHLISKTQCLNENVLAFILARQEDDADVCMVSAEKALFETPKAMGFTNLEDLLAEKAQDITSSLDELLVEDPATFHAACRGLFTYLPERAIDAYTPLFTCLINHLAVGDVVQTLTTLHSLLKCLETRCPQPRLQVETKSAESLRDFAARLLRNAEAARAAEATIGEEVSEDFNPEDMLNMKEESGDNGRYSVGDKQPADLPGPVQVCVDLIDACVNMQSGGLFVHTKAFEVIADGLTFIETYEDQLLPIVHLVWEALVYRLRSSDNFALSTKALTVLSTLCRTSRSFVRDRIVKELWPRFCSFLHEQRHASTSTPFREYCHLSVYKYQLALLECLGEYAGQLELTEEHLSKVLAPVVAYVLDAGQPVELQQAASAAVHKMAALSPECVRFHVRKAILDRRGNGCSWCDLRLRDQPDAETLKKFPAHVATW
ncbi:hypothetical protein BIW11_07385 [Tropilaelaps mercedesae]|uniref:TELO2-interacting protein 1-like n=1 Tax=Tropilaelaps mercedesae TaxID=418985 RepID=A0A1V9XU75_9ACAR|nr:hypothetical protein BIW11_07385 [Tropilaelaps mercedesae]